MPHQNNVPATPIKPKEIQAINAFADQLIMYLELEQAVGAFLGKEKRLTNQLKFKLEVECRLVFNIVKNMIGIPMPVYQEKAEQARKDPGFADEVQNLANTLAPPPPLIIPPQQCLEEIGKMRLQGKGRWSWAMD